jgi:vacuolar iron transporter family protein
MRFSYKTGLSFGLTSGVITTLGLIVGLGTGTESRWVVIGGIVTIAIADAFSDALGMHISQESVNRFSTRSIWEATLTTFVSKFFFALSFIIPMVVFRVQTAIFVSVIYGFLLLSIFSWLLAKQQAKNPLHVIGEHVTIGALVVVATYVVGIIASRFFG